MNTVLRFLTVITIIIILVLAWGFFGVVNAYAMEGMNYQQSLMPNRPIIDAHFPRWDACRTYDIGGVDPTDGIACANSGNVDHKEQAEENTAVTPATPEATTIVTTPATSTADAPAVTETPIVTPEASVTPESTPQPEVTRERGNPGNDKPVGNAGEKCDMGGFCEQGDHGNRGRGN